MWWRSDVDAFHVDAEAAMAVLAFEADAWLDSGCHETSGQAENAYLSLGVVSHPSSQYGLRGRTRLRRALYEQINALMPLESDGRSGQLSLV